MVRLLISAAGAAALVGCDQRSENAKAIESAGRDLRASGAIVGSDGDGVSDARLRDVASRVQSASTSGTDAEKGSASLILSQTMAAQGEAAAGKAKDLELAARNIMMRINSAAGEWAQRNAVAAAADALNVSKDLAAMAASKADKEKELGLERARLDKVKASVDTLVAGAKGKLAAADAKVTQYAQMTQGATKMSATESAAVFESANVIRREGDALRAEGMKIQAHADEQAPLIPEIGLLIDKLEKQIANLDATAASLRRRADAAKAESTAAREGAEKAAREIDDHVVELSKLRDSQLSPAYESAINQLRKAASTANAGTAMSPGGGKVTSGSAQLAVAEAQWAKASGARAFAGLMDALAATQPKLPNADDYKSKGEAARKEAEEAIKAATEAFELAKTAIEGGGNRITRPDVKERLTKLGQDLESKAKNVTDGIWLDLKAPPPPAAPADAGAATSEPAAVATTPVPADLRAFLETYLAAVKSRQIDQIAAMNYITDPDLKEAVTAIAGFQKAMFAADAACQSKFKQPIDQVMGSNPMLGMMFKQFGAANAKLDSLDKAIAADIPVTMNGSDKATVSVAGGNSLELIKVGGKWMESLGTKEAAMKVPPAQLKSIAAIQGVLDAWTADMAAGKFADAKAAAADFSAKLMPVMQNLMPKPPGGG